MTSRLAPLTLVALTALTPLAVAQRGAGPGPKAGPAPGLVEPPPARTIAWFGTLEAGRAEAERTGRPILFLSAAPLCGGVPGIW